MSTIEERVQNGLVWLSTEATAEFGLDLDNVCQHLDDLRLNRAEQCVIGWASGADEPWDREAAYMRLVNMRGHGWLAEHGFYAPFEDDPEGPTQRDVYEALEAEWKRVLGPMCASEEDHR